MILLINIPYLDIDKVEDSAILLFIIYFVFVINSSLVLALMSIVICKNYVLIFSRLIKTRI